MYLFSCVSNVGKHSSVMCHFTTLSITPFLGARYRGCSLTFSILSLPRAPILSVRTHDDKWLDISTDTLPRCQSQQSWRGNGGSCCRGKSVHHNIQHKSQQEQPFWIEIHKCWGFIFTVLLSKKARQGAR
jgi:hypothetical protein